jgi:hypothetical protein
VYPGEERQAAGSLPTITGDVAGAGGRERADGERQKE